MAHVDNNRVAESRMNKLLWLIATILIFFGPIAGIYLGIHPGILPILGIVCGLAAIVRGAQPLPDGDGPASPAAEVDAKILCDTALDNSPRRGIGITMLEARGDSDLVRIWRGAGCHWRSPRAIQAHMLRCATRRCRRRGSGAIDHALSCQQDHNANAGDDDLALCLF